MDAIFFQPSDDIREDPFVLPDVLGYLGMPDPACWAVSSDLNCLVGIVKLARCLRVDEILNHLGSVLEIAPESLRAMKTGMLRKKIRSQLRYISIPYVLPSILTRGIYVTFGSHQSECEPCFTEICALLTCLLCSTQYSCSIFDPNFTISRYLGERDTSTCIFCGGSWRSPPLHRDAVTMPCCLRDAHREYLNRAVMAHQECPQCEFLLSVKGVIAMQRAKGKPACLLICTTSVVVIHLTHRNLLTLSPCHNRSGQCTFRI